MGFLQSGNDSLPPSPPKFAFNGISTEPPKSPFQQTRARSGTLSDESMARKRALEEENALYPPLVPPSLFTTKQSDSPIIPLSPDPFGRFPTPAEYEEQRQSLVFAEDFPAPPTSYFHPASQAPPFVPTHQDRPPSHTPSSRFSADSVTSQDTPQQHLNVKPRGSSTLISVKSLRKLWRKSGNKGSVSGNSTPTIPDSGRTSPNASLAPPTNPQQAPLHQTPRGRNKSISKQLPPAPHESQSMNTLSAPTREPGMHELSMRPHHFEGEARYPRHPSLRPPQAPSSRSPNMPSPPLPHAPSPSGPTRTPSPNHQQQHSVSLVHQRQPSSSQHPPEKGLSVRKSILKSWKSATGLSSHNRSGSRPPSSSGPTPRSSTEQLPETGRRRRPSVLELATHAVRGSTASMATTLGDIPASPALPEQYQYQAHSRAASRQSEMNGTNGSYLDRQESVKGLFNLSSTSSPPRVRSPLHNSGSPPRSNLTTAAGSRTSQESFDSRPSFDVSQFEMISPPKTDSYVLESTLSYPYHGLDRSLVAHE